MNKNLPSHQYLITCEKKIKELLYIENFNLNEFYKIAIKKDEPIEEIIKDNENLKLAFSIYFYMESVFLCTEIVISYKNMDKFTLDCEFKNGNFMPTPDITKFQDEIINKELFDIDFKDDIVVIFENYDGSYNNMFYSICCVAGQNKKDKIYNICLFGISKPEPYMSFYYSEQNKPRIYSHCEHIDDCESYVHKSLYNANLCMKTARTMHNCKSNENISYLQMTFSILYTYNCMSKYLNTKKTIFKDYKEYEETVTKNNTTGKIKKYSYKNDFIRINTTKTIYNNLSKNRIPREYKKGTQKSEHERSSHLRTLKSGKVIQVRQSTINKGKGKKPYRI